jgi:predicted DNA repair protein MutK
VSTILLAQLFKDTSGLLDDVVGISKKGLAELDDVAGLSKKALGNTVQVSGDDVAVGGGMASGGSIRQDREYAVFRRLLAGSILNKVWMAPILLTLQTLAPAVAHALLGVGGVYLCLEGAEKTLEGAFETRWGRAVAKRLGFHAHHPVAAPQKAPALAVSADPAARPNLLTRLLGVDPKERRTLREMLTLDIILSCEILLVALKTLEAAPLMHQIATLGIVGASASAMVYGAILFIMRSDNIADALERRTNKAAKKIGAGLRRAMPSLMHGLSLIGTAAMLGVGGQILTHLLPSGLAAIGASGAAQAVEAAFAGAGSLFDFVPWVGGFVGNAAMGLGLGALAVGTKAVLVDPALRLARQLIGAVKKTFVGARGETKPEKPRIETPAPKPAPALQTAEAEILAAEPLALSPKAVTPPVVQELPSIQEEPVRSGQQATLHSLPPSTPV